MDEAKVRILKYDELDDVTGSVKPQIMDSESIMEVLKGHKFHFSLDSDHVKDSLIEARRISEKIFKRATVNI